MVELHRTAGLLEHGEEPSLHRLTERVAELETRLAQSSALRAVVVADAKLADLAETIYRARQRRRIPFDAELFGEPAWDMLLDLFINHHRGRRITSTSLCLAAGAPHATGLRWTRILHKNGLLRQFQVPDDARLRVVEITPKGFRLMREYLTDVIERLGLTLRPEGDCL